MGRVQIRVLGEFSVEIDGVAASAAAFERRSGADLLQVLALAPGHRRHREQVIDLLWPEASRSSGMNQLNKAASFARKALGDPRAVVVSGESLVLFPDREVEVDADLVTDVDPTDPAALARAARAAARGELLPDTPYADWAVDARHRIHARQMELLHAARRWTDALALDPTDETSHVGVMTDAVDRLDRAAALRQFELLTSALDEVGLEPGPASRALRDRATELDVDIGRPEPSSLAARSVPPLRSATFGRVDERKLVADLIDEQHVVTLVGPGGVGKTHLGVHVAHDIADEFEDGTRWCELGNVVEADAAHDEILRALGGVRHGDRTAAESIVAALSDRSALLLLDNCEHVLDAVRPLVDRLVDSAPGIKVVATSRVPLTVAGESVVRIEALDRSAAVALFVAEAERVGRAVDPTDPLVERICARLDDLPLALRLAGARARSLDLIALDALLADRFEHLVDTGGRGLAHQQTLRTTIEWSVNALDRQARSFLIAISVFANRFSLDDIAAVTDGTAPERMAVLDDLVQRSLVIFSDTDGLDGDGRPTYRLLESIRLVARESLDPATRDRHFELMLASVKTWRSSISEPDNSALRHFTDGWDDVRIAVTTGISTGRHREVVELLAHLSLFGSIDMRFEMLDWYDRVLDADATSFPDIDVARGHAAWSSMATFHGDFGRGRLLAERVSSACPDLPEAAWAMAWIPWTSGDLDGARHWLDVIEASVDPSALPTQFASWHLRSIIDFADGQDISAAAHLLDVLSVDLGATARTLALITRALSTLWTDADSTFTDLEECLHLSDGHGLANASMTGRSAVALAAAAHGSIAEALTAGIDTLTYAMDRGLWSWVLAGIGTTAAVMEDAGRPDAAATLLGARQGSGYRSGFTAGLVVLQEERLRRDHPDRIEPWLDAGRRLTPLEAGNFAVRTSRVVRAQQPT